MDGDAGGVIAREALRGYVSRVASLHDQRDELNADIREVYREAKEAGFDTTVLREVVREYRMQDEARASRYSLLAQYREALGLLRDYGDADPPQGRRRGRRQSARNEIADAMQRAQDHLGNGGSTVDDYRPDA